MTKDDIIRMAREAGGLNCDCCLPEPEPHEMQKFIEHFAALVAAYEREVCAQIAFNAKTYIEAAAAIRAREKK
jgi:hypothetical protein